MDDDNHPLDPWGIQKQRQEEKRGAGVGFLAIPLVFPLLAAVIAALYPLAGAAVLGLAIVVLAAGSSLGIPAEHLGGGLLVPALALVWLFGRLDIWLGQWRLYWWGRHVYRTVVLSCLFIYVATSNAEHDGSIGGIISALFEVPLRFVIASALILGTQAALVGRDGAIKTLWHGILEFLRVRPADVDEYAPDTDEADATSAASGIAGSDSAGMPAPKGSLAPSFERTPPVDEPDGGERRRPLHAGLPTVILAIVVGWWLGSALAVRFFGQAGAGGIAGILVMLLLFAFVNGQLRRRRWRVVRATAEPAVQRSTPRTLLTFTVGAIIAASALGVLFALSEGDIDPVVAAARFGALGAGPGLAIGLMVSWRLRRRGPRL